MLGSNSKPDRPSAQEQSRLRENEQVAGQTARLGGMVAADNQPMSDKDPDDFLESLGDPDIESEVYQDLEGLLQPHLSSRLTTTYYENQDRQGIKAHNLALSKRVLRERNPGRLCFGPFLEHAQRVDGRPDLPTGHKWTDPERRAIRTALTEVRTAMQMLSVNHVGLSKTADTTVNNRIQRIDNDDSEPGRLGRASSRIFG